VADVVFIIKGAKFLDVLRNWRTSEEDTSFRREFENELWDFVGEIYAHGSVCGVVR
jgi:hypothetical protein